MASPAIIIKMRERGDLFILELLEVTMLYHVDNR